ncbi:MAG: oligosaccharide flippase family protein [Eubacteriales bacterium]
MREKQPSPRKENSFLGGVAVLALGAMVVKLIGMFYKIPLLNLIGEQGSADFYNAYSIYAILLTVSATGLPVAISKLISEAQSLGDTDEVQNIFTISARVFMVIGFVSFIVMFCFSQQLANLLNNPLANLSIKALSPSVLFMSAIAAYRGYFQGHREMGPTAISQIIEAFFKLFLGLFLAFAVINMTFTTDHLTRYRPTFDFSDLTPDALTEALLTTQTSLAAAAAILGVTVGTVIAALFLGICYHRRRKPRRKGGALSRSSTKKILLSLFQIAIPITITSSISSIITLIDTGLVQGQLQSALGMTLDQSRTLFGSYTSALNLYNLPASLVGTITVSIIPAVSAAYAAKNRRRAYAITLSALRITSLLAMPMGVGLFTLGTPIMALMYPKLNSEVSGPLLSTLGIASIFVCLTLVCVSILQVNEFFYLPILISALGGVAKVITNYILVGNPAIGIHGAPIGSVVCFVLCFGLSVTVITLALPKLPSLLPIFLKPLLASVIMGLSAWAFYGLFCKILFSLSFQEEVGGALVLSYSGGAIATLCAIACAGIIYLVLIVLIGAITKEDLSMMPKGEKLMKFLK